MSTALIAVAALAWVPLLAQAARWLPGWIARRRARRASRPFELFDLLDQVMLLPRRGQANRWVVLDARGQCDAYLLPPGLRPVGRDAWSLYHFHRRSFPAVILS